MRKKKWKKVLIWVASVIVVLGVGGLFAANYAVDKLISTLAADLENDLMNEVVTAVEENSNDPVDGSDKTTTYTADEIANPSDDQPVGSVDELVESEQGRVDSAQTDSSTQTEDVQSKDSYQAEVPVDKAKVIQEKITVGEKAQLTSVFLEELSMSDIKDLQALASGGLSIDEKKEARSLILNRLSPEQYDELIQIAKKYGMSQGKSYGEVIEEK
ncbi:hypothetical protein [Paenibacillus prosopidis]|uniref:Uncharacterized protein n=1 Tax=Paenibacillus prosopidis TaxID=630520 RepID=A0A368W1U8_9BACL|nr:hypothetical protein [Paenibacillus prosopidis]RCW47892.1 hypothetical protein DFP97_10792 [Paenibacillus prosopidis]